MVQRDLLDRAGDVIIDIAHHIAHLERLEREDHHAADHAAQRLLRGKTGNDRDHAAGSQQRAYRTRQHRYRADNDHAARKVHRRDRYVTHKAQHRCDAAVALPVTIHQLFHQPADNVRRHQRQQKHRHGQYARGNKLPQRRSHKFIEPFEQCLHSFRLPYYIVYRTIRGL